jgi:CDP-glucose 4,6-dehydratase
VEQRPGRLEDVVSEASFWQDRATLVTGATGLLGGWVVRELLARGAQVVTLVRDWVPEAFLHGEGLTERVSVVRGAVEDMGVLERVLGEYEVDAVFHLAAQTIVGIANRNPISTFESNIRGTWCLLEACRRSPKVRRVVVASSDKAYGTVDVLPYTEDTPLAGRHPYDVSKSCADLISLCYAESFAAPVCVTRCGNLYGGGDLNWNRIVPGTLRSLLRGEAPVIRSDGQSVRDYVYVEDAAAAYLDLAQHMEREEIRGRAYNFSNEEPLTVLELVERIGILSGISIEPRVLNEASGEIPRQFLCAARARAELGWAPRYGLDEGLKRTLEWYRTFLGAGA